MNYYRKQAYQAFLMSDFWREISSLKKALVGECEQCGQKWDLQAHHKTYPKNWFHTTLEQLEVVCRDCHEWLHDRGCITPFESARQRVEWDVEECEKGNKDAWVSMEDAGWMCYLVKTPDELKQAHEMVRRIYFRNTTPEIRQREWSNPETDEQVKRSFSKYSLWFKNRPPRPFVNEGIDI